MFPSFSIASDSYTDGGYRFKKNTFEGEDHWLPGFPIKETTFYDFEYYNTDTLISD